MEGGISPPTSNHWTQTGYPTSQFNFETILEMVLLPNHRLKAQAYRTVGPHPDLFQMPITSSSCHLCFSLIGYKLVVPTTPSLGLINLLEQLRELRETFYLLGNWLIIKGYNSGTTIWKRCIGQGKGKGHGASKLSRYTALPKSNIFTNLEALRTLCFWVYGRLHYIGMVD